MVCNEFVRQSTKILFDHPLNQERLKDGLNPANIVLMRGAGEMGNFEPFTKKYGLSGQRDLRGKPDHRHRQGGRPHAMSRAGDHRLAGQQHRRESRGGNRRTQDKGLCARQYQGGRRVRARRARGAEDAISSRRADAALEPLLGLKDCIIIICADHTTPCTIKDHSADPVPVIIRGDGVRMDDVVRFDEYTCAKGGLDRITGAALLPTALDLINKAHKFGA